MHSRIRLTMDCRTLLWVLGRLRMFGQSWNHSVGEVCLYFHLEPNALGVFFLNVPTDKNPLGWSRTNVGWGSWTQNLLVCGLMFIWNLFLFWCGRDSPEVRRGILGTPVQIDVYMCRPSGHNASRNYSRSVFSIHFSLPLFPPLFLVILFVSTCL